MRPVILPRLGDMLFISILLAALALGQRMINQDSDLGRHLTQGNYILSSGQIPTVDIFSFTHAGWPRPPYEWVAQVLLAGADRAMGLAGVVVLVGSAIAASFLVVYEDAVQRGASHVVSLGITALAAVASSLHWLTRPHVFTFFFLGLWMWLLDASRRGSRRSTWALPLVMLLWSNFHGGFVFGFIAWLAYAAGWLIAHRRRDADVNTGRDLVIAGLTSLAASLLTPSPGGNWSAVLRNSSAYILANTAETQPLRLDLVGTWPFVALVLLGFALAVRRRHSLVTAHWLLLLGFAGLGIGAMRNIPLFCIVAVPILALWAGPHRATTLDADRLRQRIDFIEGRRSGYLWSALAVATVIGGIGWRSTFEGQTWFSFDPDRYPVGAVDWAQEHYLSPRTFNDINWGGYLLYRRWPSARVFIDSQADFYGEPFVREYATIAEASGDWSEGLRQYNVSSVILGPAAPLSAALLGDPAWGEVYRDSTAVVLIRR